MLAAHAFTVARGHDVETCGMPQLTDLAWLFGERLACRHPSRPEPAPHDAPR
ncbi:hypothetical protein [Streptomyces sp. NPDC048155]|uniref:hypothetical protein n=1 Tax=Streptomyces sp. NPDC048155 TaxID=3154818 RepID=UPI0033D139B5